MNDAVELAAAAISPRDAMERLDAGAAQKELESQ
jgi:hypothetical protein